MNPALLPILLAGDGTPGGPDPDTTPPVVEITTGASVRFTPGSSPMTLSATATDETDGDLSDSIGWYIVNALGPGVDLELGTGASIDISESLGAGTGGYTVRAVAADQSGNIGSDTIAVTIADPPESGAAAPAVMGLGIGMGLAQLRG